mgnify:CR=1 FL=1|jgi:hypothetical protein
MRELLHNVSHILYKGVAAAYKTKIGFLYDLSESGSSNTLFEATVLNSLASCNKFLDFNAKELTPELLVRSLALTCYKRAKTYGHIPQLFGLAIVEDKGYIYVALQTMSNTVCKSIKPKPLSAKRHSELITEFVFKTMLQYLTIARPLSSRVLEYTCNSNTALSQSIIPLLENTTNAVYPFTDTPPEVIFSGSWDPLTQEHMYVASIAEVFCNSKVYFEVSMDTIRGPSLDLLDAERLIQQFDNMYFVITKAPTFLEKAKIFPNVTFVVGIDTWLKVIDPKYYAFPLDELINRFNQYGSKFLVFGRQEGERWLTMSEDQTYDIARKVPQHTISDTPEEDYEPEDVMRSILEIKSLPKPEDDNRRHKRKHVVGL